MNERIKELADSADYLADQIIQMPGEYHPDWHDVRDLKFAELIVKECCKTLEEMHLLQSVNNQNYPSAWHDAVDQGIENIKEHFGVK